MRKKVLSICLFMLFCINLVSYAAVNRVYVNGKKVDDKSLFYEKNGQVYLSLNHLLQFFKDKSTVNNYGIKINRNGNEYEFFKSANYYKLNGNKVFFNTQTINGVKIPTYTSFETNGQNIYAPLNTVKAMLGYNVELNSDLIFIGQKPTFMTLTEDYINTLNLSSKTKYLIYVSLQEQRVYVFEGSKNNWKLIKTFLCATGKKGTETITGIFDIKERGLFFFSKYGVGAKYWVQFYGDYLFHTFPMNKKGQIVDYTLGKPASHGCIRLEVENARWIYDTIPRATTVYIK